MMIASDKRIGVGRQCTGHDHVIAWVSSDNDVWYRRDLDQHRVLHKPGENIILREFGAHKDACKFVIVQHLCQLHQ